MSRNEAKSYVVQYQPMGKGLDVVGTHLAPGYTEAHKATAKEAIEYAITQKKDLIDHEISEISKLMTMLHAM